MKILIAGDWHSMLHEQALYDALIENGHDAHAFAWHTYFLGTPVFDKWGLIPRAQNKYLLGPRVNRLNRDLLECAHACKPDAIIVYRGSHIFPRTLRLLKETLPGTKLLGYNNDDPFSLHYPKWLWRHFRGGIPEYDLVLSYRPANIKEYVAAGARRVHLWRSWFCPSLHRPLVLNDQDELRFDCDVVFVGHFENDGRLSALASLAEAGFKVKIFGPYKGLGPSGWHGKIDRYPSLSGSVPTEYLSGEKYVKALCGARIALCFLSKLNRDSYTRRCFEIPAVGAALFSEYSEDLGSLFSEGIDAELFRNHAELIAKVGAYLNDAPRLAALRAAGTQRVWKEGHDVGSRAKQLVEWIEDIA